MLNFKLKEMAEGKEEEDEYEDCEVPRYSNVVTKQSYSRINQCNYLPFLYAGAQALYYVKYIIYSKLKHLFTPN